MLDNHLGSGGVTIKGKASNWSSFQNNVTDNLAIITKGAVTIGFVNANDGTRGTTINSSGGSVTISEGRFNNNDEYDLDILAAGTISLSKIECESNNGTWGARLDNHTGSGGITINDLASDWDNYDSNLGTNLILNTAGAVTMNYVIADGYNISTRSLEFPNTVGNVVVNNVDVDNILGAYYGIQLTSTGTVSISNVISNNTPGGGIWIDNSVATTSKNVTLLNIDAYDNSGQYRHLRALQGRDQRQKY